VTGLQDTAGTGGRTYQIKPAINNGSCNPRIPQSHTSGAINLAMGDGRVTAIGAQVGYQTWWAAITPNSSDTIGNDWE